MTGLKRNNCQVGSFFLFQQKVLHYGTIFEDKLS